MVRKKRNPQLVVEVEIVDYELLLERLDEADDLEALQEMQKKPLKFRPFSEFLDESAPSVMS
jgi:hypothetical protein